MDAEPNDHHPAQEHGDTSPTAAADTCLVKEVCGDLFDAPEGSGLIRKYPYIMISDEFSVF